MKRFGLWWTIVFMNLAAGAGVRPGFWRRFRHLGSGSGNGRIYLKCLSRWKHYGTNRSHSPSATLLSDEPVRNDVL
jgi:hypothetical protein